MKQVKIKIDVLLHTHTIMIGINKRSQYFELN